ncbi:hypothetical protein [Marinomonas ostreistagni]|uniref:hypothetical protein n=1 Tax=Marinomonas ostreistagni TaxID=359209 RepID=UPI0019522377|nr:hypothetical protein [Marinomonas ostreistagni]MBM6550601.1 hypothetical protein [Marinomonas ostreistagni]
MKFIGLIISALAALGVALNAAAEQPPQFNTLTITGAISSAEDAPVKVDLATLKTLPVEQIVTHNPWEEGLHTYTGFNPVDLLEQLDAEGDVLRVTAFNQYITEIPLSDFAEHKAIIAYEMDYRPITVRNKGPFIVIYDFDNNAMLRNEAYYGRSIWQIESIEVLDSGD